MDIFEQFATDVTLETEGRWVDFGGKPDKPTQIKIARTGTAAYTAYMQDFYLANQAELESKDKAVSAAAQQRGLIGALATHCLKDWKNASYKGDTKLTVELAKTMLGHQDFRDRVVSEATKQEAYRVVQAEADAKN